MPYKFLHHLTQADLPVVIYDDSLIKQLSAYEHQSLIVLARQEVPRGVQVNAHQGIRVLKITLTGRRAVRRHLKVSKYFEKISD